MICTPETHVCVFVGTTTAVPPDLRCRCGAIAWATPEDAEDEVTLVVAPDEADDGLEAWWQRQAEEPA